MWTGQGYSPDRCTCCLDTPQMKHSAQHNYIAHGAAMSYASQFWAPALVNLLDSVNVLICPMCPTRLWWKGRLMEVQAILQEREVLHHHTVKLCSGIEMIWLTGLATFPTGRREIDMISRTRSGVIHKCIIVSVCIGVLRRRFNRYNRRRLFLFCTEERCRIFSVARHRPTHGTEIGKRVFRDIRGTTCGTGGMVGLCSTKGQ
jgi:hypothetical protein